MMTVAELRRLLAAHPNHAVVVLAKDAEGNDFTPLADSSAQAYVPSNGWSGEIRDAPGGRRGDLRPGESLAVVLWPIN